MEADRHLVGRQSLTAVAIELGVADRHGEPHDHDRHRDAAPGGVGLAHHGGIDDGGVLAQDRLDLRGVDVLAPRDDQVVAAIGDAQQPVSVQRAQVPGAQPAIGQAVGAGCRIAHVALEHHRPLHLDLTHAISGVGVHHAHVDARQGPQGRGVSQRGSLRTADRDAG